jgi:hypothetical protein
MTTATKISPLLSVGTFGTHLTENPNGSFGFVGTVPNDFQGKVFKTFDEGFNAFVEWFNSQPVDFRREHVGNLRNDVFVSVMESA